MINKENLIWCVRCNRSKRACEDDVVMRTALRLTPDGPVPYGICSCPDKEQCALDKRPACLRED